MHYTVLQILFLEISNTFMSFIASKFHHINNYLLIILLVNLNFLQSLYDGLFWVKLPKKQSVGVYFDNMANYTIY